MFSTEERVKNCTGKDKVGRFKYLKQLTEEIQSTRSEEAKLQVMANLANFAYDPYNYEYLRTLGVIDIFLEQLSGSNTKMIRFALGGLCNLALDGLNKEYINNNGGITLVSKCLSSSCIETVTYAITTLMFLVNVKFKTEITCDDNIKQMIHLAEHPDRRVKSLAQIFLEDYCDRNRVQRVRTNEIPLPPPLDTAPLSPLNIAPLSPPYTAPFSPTYTPPFSPQSQDSS